MMKNFKVMKKLKKYTYLLHRYLGIILAPIILLWSFSGLVMMYVPYPKLAEVERLQLLPEIVDFSCCNADFYEQILPVNIQGLSIEMLNDEPIIKLESTRSGNTSYHLNSQTLLAEIDQQMALSIAKAALPSGIESIENIEKIEQDQWTVYSKYNKHRPLFKVSFADEESSQLYLSSKSGEVVQLTTAFQRNWSWVGAVTHWLYPTFLRKHTSLWYWLVIWLTIFSLVLLMTGVWLGIKQLKKRKNKPLSPYRGMRLVHHWGGVIISAILFSFLLSGLLSMNPWGVLESKRFSTDSVLGKQAGRLAVIDSLTNLPNTLWQTGFVSLKLSPWNNEVYWLATDTKGAVIRYDKNFSISKLPQTELTAAGNKLSGGADITQGLIWQEDEYYYAHKDNIELPIWKVERVNGESTELFYLSPSTGEMRKNIDNNGRIYRWLFKALHRWDFSQSIRQRPVWDFSLVPFMLFLILFSFSGCYIAVQRLRSKF